MLLQVTKMERRVKKNKKGEDMEGLWVEGMKQFDDKEPEKWEKFLMDWKDAEHIADLEQIGIGKLVLIKMIRNGRFWDIDSVEKWRGEAPSPTSGYDNNKEEKPSETLESSVSVVPAIGPKGFSIRKAALDAAIKYVNVFVQAPERFKKLLKSAVTIEFVDELLFEYRDEFEKYLKDTTTKEESVDAGAETTTGDMPEQEDIPF